MNERIKELMKQASTTRVTGFGEIDTLDPEKFAELIVKECQEVVRWSITMNSTIEQVPAFIKEHFGVTE